MQIKHLQSLSHSTISRGWLTHSMAARVENGYGEHMHNVCSQGHTKRARVSERAWLTKEGEPTKDDADVCGCVFDEAKDLGMRVVRAR